MPKFKSEFTVCATNDETDVGAFFVYVEAEDEREAAKKMRQWILSQIHVYPQDIYEVDDFPEKPCADPNGDEMAEFIVGRASKTDQIMGLLEHE